jgi:hypothetical protein
MITERANDRERERESDHKDSERDDDKHRGDDRNSGEVMQRQATTETGDERER